MTPVDLLDLLAPHHADDEHDEIAFRARRAIVASMGRHAGELKRLVGMLRVLPAAFAGRRFDVAIRGVEPELAAMFLVLDEDEEPIDAVAWPIARPEAAATFLGRGIALGLPQLEAHSGSPLVEPLPIQPTALEWLQSGGVGIAPIDLRRTAKALLLAEGRFAVRSDHLGAKLQLAMRQLVDPGRIVVDRALAEAA